VLFPNNETLFSLELHFFLTDGLDSSGGTDSFSPMRAITESWREGREEILRSRNRFLERVGLLFINLLGDLLSLGIGLRLVQIGVILELVVLLLVFLLHLDALVVSMLLFDTDVVLCVSGQINFVLVDLPFFPSHIRNMHIFIDFLADFV
jgi:hypothetical protein